MGGRGWFHSPRGHQGELRSLWEGRGACAGQARAGVGTPWGRVAELSREKPQAPFGTGGRLSATYYKF